MRDVFEWSITIANLLHLNTKAIIIIIIFKLLSILKQLAFFMVFLHVSHQVYCLGS